MSSLASLVGLAGVGSWAWLLTMRGAFWRIERAPHAPSPESWPEVVAVIPARDEAEVIGDAVESLLSQNYPGILSVVVVDDNSSDGTAELARARAESMGVAGRLSVVRAPDLPPGWTGKMWAQNFGVTTARAWRPNAELLLLTDADISHGKGELRYMVAKLLHLGLDMASLMVRLRTESIWEKAVVPAFVFFFRMLYPFSWVSDPRSTTAAAAGGYVLTRPATLERIGGIKSIKDALIDDCTLAAAAKAEGCRLTLDLAEESVSLRGYNGPSGLWKMISRSAYTQLRHSPWLLLGTILAMLVIFVAPPILAFRQGGGASTGALAWAAMTLSYYPIIRYYRLLPVWAPLLPVVTLFYLGATFHSAVKYWRGEGGEWKGRIQDKQPAGARA
ncbi:glycosyl transferase family 2 [Paramagnetospirillum kuznetsovii]|uniref:Glycosyl transferase family 2 n=1 Tax=Paramagnetospirillum kuznetsovii TaxID=2053833 RepID=A0A364NTK4_9PROT|nr:glycosyltransferase [Paramagnetospirillum kuznetsovii]RAU20398.1 glycosyl transferase family 2 [Paramagnetospirillum kuznetsovii]